MTTHLLNPVGFPGLAFLLRVSLWAPLWFSATSVLVLLVFQASLFHRLPKSFLLLFHKYRNLPKSLLFQITLFLQPKLSVSSHLLADINKSVSSFPITFLHSHISLLRTGGQLYLMSFRHCQLNKPKDRSLSLL